MKPPLAYWVDRLDPFLVHFSGNIGIRYYGLSYAAGFLAAAWLLSRYARAGRSLLPADKLAEIMVAAVVGVVVGGVVGAATGASAEVGRGVTLATMTVAVRKAITASAINASATTTAAAVRAVRIESRRVTSRRSLCGSAGQAAVGLPIPASRWR